MIAAATCWRATALAALALLAAGCGGGGAPDGVRAVVGETLAVGQGSARSWVGVGNGPTPEALGITFSEGVLSALAAGGAGTLTLRLPRAAAPFDHVELRWIAGAAGDGLFEQPHLGVLFSLVSAGERETMTDSAAASEIPPLELIPRSYVPLPGPLPRRGSRWIDPTAPELNGEPLAGSLLYGFYGGRLSFLEPRIGLAHLQSQRELEREIKLPRRFARPGHYPSRYRVRYDPSAHEYSIVLEGLVQRP